MLDNKNYITIQGWMIKELGLKGNKLLTYALIYGFTQDGKSEFNGSLTYIADWVGVTKRATIDILNDLMDKQLIVKVEHTIGNIKVYSYKVTSAENFTTSEKTSPGSEKTSPGSEKTSPGSEKTSPNNNIYNNIYNNIPPLNNNNKLLLLSPQGEKWSFVVDFVKKPDEPFAIEDFEKYEYLIPSLRVWLPYKAKRKQKYQDATQILKLCEKLHNLCAGNPDIAMKIVDQSLADNYAGLFPLKNQPLASNEDLTAFIEIWNKFVARTTEDIANIRLNYAFTPKVKAVTESDVRTMIPMAKSVLTSVMGSLPQKSGAPAINGWSGYDQSDQWRFATSILYIRWRNSKFLREMPVTAAMFLKHIDKIADPYNDCYLDK